MKSVVVIVERLGLGVRGNEGRVRGFASGNERWIMTGKTAGTVHRNSCQRGFDFLKTVIKVVSINFL